MSRFTIITLQTLLSLVHESHRVMDANLIVPALLNRSNTFLINVTSFMHCAMNHTCFCLSLQHLCKVAIMNEIAFIFLLNLIS